MTMQWLNQYHWFIKAFASLTEDSPNTKVQNCTVNQ